jgi:hypothetical protein
MHRHVLLSPAGFGRLLALTSVWALILMAAIMLS